MSQNLSLCVCQALSPLHCPIHNPQLQWYPNASGILSPYQPSGDVFIEPPAETVVQADQPFVAFRNWKHACEQRAYRLTPFSPVRYLPTGIQLLSIGVGNGQPSPWNDDTARAVCRYGQASPHHHNNPRCPVKECECGLYTWKKPDLIGPHGGGTLWGAVLIWGRVIEHEEGFRSEYAKIICLADNGKDITPYVARERGVRVVPYDKVALYAGEFGRVF